MLALRVSELLGFSFLGSDIHLCYLPSNCLVFLESGSEQSRIHCSITFESILTAKHKVHIFHYNGIKCTTLRRFIVLHTTSRYWIVSRVGIPINGLLPTLLGSTLLQVQRTNVSGLFGWLWFSEVLCGRENEHTDKLKQSKVRYSVFPVNFHV